MKSEPKLRLRRCRKRTRTTHPVAKFHVRRFDMEPRNKIIAAPLAIFLGTLGVHAFYIGNNTMGLLLLIGTLVGGWFTFGIIPAIIWFITIIQGIKYLTTSNDNFNRKYVREQRWI